VVNDRIVAIDALADPKRIVHSTFPSSTDGVGWATHATARSRWRSRQSPRPVARNRVATLSNSVREGGSIGRTDGVVRRPLDPVREPAPAPVGPAGRCTHRSPWRTRRARRRAVRSVWAHGSVELLTDDDPVHTHT
jgi:hypothetical protein